MKELEHVLCIDDEDDILDIVRLCLETMSNISVTYCNAGDKALNRLNSTEPDMILLDVMMPNMSGIDVLKALKENEKTKTIPIAFMTARIQPNEISEYIKMGAIGVIPKPFDPMTLGPHIMELWVKYHEQNP